MQFLYAMPQPSFTQSRTHRYQNTVEPRFTNLIRSWRPFVTRNVRKLKLCVLSESYTATGALPPILPACRQPLSACVFVTRDTVRHPRLFFFRKICSWTDLFVMRGVREPRYHCIHTHSIKGGYILLDRVWTVIFGGGGTTASHNNLYDENSLKQAITDKISPVLQNYWCEYRMPLSKIITYFRTPWSRLLLEKLTRFQLVK
jgi:hypothetical protein